MDCARSAEQTLDCDVPEGSVLGLGFFSDHGAPVAENFHQHGVAHHLYADYTQVYLTFSPGKEAEARKKLELCLQDVRL